ncbi:diguanylate cyclase [Pusillimonas sp.]|uniref:diguanylate cyclase n=1 Tax=Pusillimonas sp. TaxID=3040095 RepID=UPI0037C5DEE3
MFESLFRVDLRRLILWMCLFFVFLALGNSMHAAYQVQHGLLLQHSLDTNRSYAERLAHVTDSFIASSAQVLEAAALDVTESRLDPAATQKELEQLASISDTFSTLIAVDSSGKIFAALPGSAFLVGTLLQASQVRQLLNVKGVSTISGAFKGPSGRWLSVIAHPIFLPEGGYAGFIGGAIRLQGGSALQTALAKHHYQNGSYFYIVDETGTVVYHPQQDLIGSSFQDTEPVPELLRGKAGTQRTSNAESHDQLVSYAPIPFANWGVVVQRPTEIALSNIDKLLLQTLYHTLPLFIISLLAIWWLARLIAYPLHELAEVAANLDNRASFLRIRFIKGWYVEAALIQKGLLQSFSAVGSRLRKLHREGSTDPLTGVGNRRGLDTAIGKLMKTAQNVAAVMVDIDHFKAINDRHGHAAGDEVLRTMTAMIMAEARKEDVVARTGGEEFVILLPDTKLDSARQFAERLRSVIEQTRFDGVGHVTISLGVACYPEHGASVHDAMALADTALYQAKAAGRNRVHLAI